MKRPEQMARQIPTILYEAGRCFVVAAAVDVADAVLEVSEALVEDASARARRVTVVVMVW